MKLMLDINVLGEKTLLETIKALSEKSRMNILQILQTGEYSITDLSKKTGLTMANVSAQVKKLEAVNLVSINYQPGEHGTKKLSSCNYKEIEIQFIKKETSQQESEK